ncbi:gustatory receptor 23a-like [Homalodisca vitripennis]|uniref:gustatory receptor 23a-like n=1 Tax=Homalodisca vitripennis TaxID=197043 RepID=UPI001EECC9F5|nr:gustatory receptor 23a-like [Homalodisca vitripennis]
MRGRQNLQHSNQSHRQDGRSSTKIKSFMNAYQTLPDAVGQANAFYSDVLLSLIFCKFVTVTVLLFVFFSPVTSERRISNIFIGIWTLCNICYLLLIVSSSSDVTQAAEETAPIICKLINEDLDQGLKQQLESFLMQIATQNVVFSARDFFQINRRMLTTMAATVTTNLVILIQFNTQSKNDN